MEKHKCSKLQQPFICPRNWVIGDYKANSFSSPFIIKKPAFICWPQWLGATGGLLKIQQTGVFDFSIHISCRDNKYRVQLYDFRGYEGTAREPIWSFNVENRIGSKRKYDKGFLIGFDRKVNFLIYDLKRNMRSDTKDF